MRLRAMLAVGILIVLGALGAGCSSDDAPTDTLSTTTTSVQFIPSTTSGAPDVPCGDLEGQPGVVRLSCDGTGQITFRTGDTTVLLRGATCTTKGDHLTVSAGTETDDDWKGERPDFAGLLLPAEPGSFDDGGVAVHYRGIDLTLPDLRGNHNGTSGTFAVRYPKLGAEISGSFTC